MSEKSISESLIAALNKSIDQASESNKQSNERMDELAGTMNSLAKTVERSEERHIAHSDGLERVGTELKELRKEVKIYSTNNDERVMTVEKGFILLEQSDRRIKSRFSKIDKFGIGIASTIFGAIVLVWLGFK